MLHGTRKSAACYRNRFSTKTPKLVGLSTRISDRIESPNTLLDDAKAPYDGGSGKSPEPVKTGCSSLMEAKGPSRKPGQFRCTSANQFTPSKPGATQKM